MYILIRVLLGKTSVKVLRHWKKLPREVVELPFLNQETILDYVFCDGILRCLSLRLIDSHVEAKLTSCLKSHKDLRVYSSSQKQTNERTKKKTLQVKSKDIAMPEIPHIHCL